MTRQAVLEAARSRFSQDGYAAATIRKIAADAGVDASLVIQFYGSKDALFAAAMSLSPTALTHLSQAFDGPPPTLGERVTNAFLDLWEGESQVSEPLLAMLRAAISNDQGAATLREFIQTRLLEQLSPKLPDGHDAAARAGFAAAMLIGIVVGRGIVKVPVLVGTDRESVIRLVAPAIQAVLVGV
ncbi:MAG: TetR family transcriptional regulator [Devosia sp.]|nr:TetR family transcriptional regulator [Devosia sp.]MDB5586093.1 TetR family transcriptional regulator [Devosia sp.]